MKRAPNQPTSDLVLWAGIYCKTWTVPDRGTLLPQHAHRWSHVSYIVSGVVRIWSGDELLGDFVGPCAVRIPAFTLHKFLTLSDAVTILCIHNADHADPDGALPVHEVASLELED